MNQTVYPYDALCVTHDLEEVKEAKKKEKVEKDDPDGWDANWGYITDGYYGDFDDDEIDVALQNKDRIQAMIKPEMLYRRIKGEDPHPLAPMLSPRERFRHLFKSAIRKIKEEETVDMKVCWYKYEEEETKRKKKAELGHKLRMIRIGGCVTGGYYGDVDNI